MEKNEKHRYDDEWFLAYHDFQEVSIGRLLRGTLLANIFDILWDFCGRFRKIISSHPLQGWRPLENPGSASAIRFKFRVGRSPFKLGTMSFHDFLERIPQFIADNKVWSKNVKSSPKIIEICRSWTGLMKKLPYAVKDVRFSNWMEFHSREEFSKS